MKILNQNNNISFKSTPLHRLRIPKADGIGSVSAFFSKLDPCNDEDRVAIETIKRTWSDSLATDNFCIYFSKPPDSSTYYCIELADNTPLARRIVGLVKLSDQNQNLHLDALVIRDDCQSHNTQCKFRNVGKITMGAIFNEARKLRYQSLSLDPLRTALNFYERIFKEASISHDISRRPPYRWNIRFGDFGRYIRYIQEKFSINFAQPITETTAQL